MKRLQNLQPFHLTGWKWCPIPAAIFNMWISLKGRNSVRFNLINIQVPLAYYHDFHSMSAMLELKTVGNWLQNYILIQATDRQEKNLTENEWRSAGANKNVHNITTIFSLNAYVSHLAMEVGVTSVSSTTSLKYKDNFNLVRFCSSFIVRKCIEQLIKSETRSCRKWLKCDLIHISFWF